jgi:hypothetical protein
LKGVESMEVARTTRRDTFIAGRSKGPLLLSRAYTRTADIEEREAGALAVLDEPLRDDIGHELVSVVDALAVHS